MMKYNEKYDEICWNVVKIVKKVWNINKFDEKLVKYVLNMMKIWIKND